ncbi:hypothetical protein E2562_023853 [Oryza meyeriana var. granulata]|uniref:F-box domain-containing protein n=1 Tax=Oryza meyeriana var. granulata TaxID=110450 RepID=A0A6G1D739_9ORYZ|nr:hypothetical protein E2562_023853 [Oryza meyeriana var. granulata]
MNTDGFAPAPLVSALKRSIAAAAPRATAAPRAGADRRPNAGKIEETVDEMSDAYQELLAALAAVVAAQGQSGGEKTAAVDAALEALKQRRELFHVACDHANKLVESIRQRILVDGATGASSSSAALAFSDDAIRLILLGLPSAALAARASLISRRWRNIWATLPELRFPDVTDLASVSAALRLRVAPVLRLHIESNDRAPDKITTVLDLAAPSSKASSASTSSRRRRTKIRGVFAKLTALRLRHFRLDKQNQHDLGAAVPSEGFLSSFQLCAMPRLRRLAASGLLYRPSTVQHLHSLPLLQHFVAARVVHLSLDYPPSKVNYELLVEAVNTLPAVELFSLKMEKFVAPLAASVTSPRTRKPWTSP